MVRLGLLPRLHSRTYIRPHPVSIFPLKQQALNRQIPRQLTNTARIWQKQLPADQKAEAQILLKADSLENVMPEAVLRPSDARSHTGLKTDPLLSEQTVSNKEQRKADWAIMKEMSRYLWPKVSHACSKALTGLPDGRYRMI